MTTVRRLPHIECERRQLRAVHWVAFEKLGEKDDVYGSVQVGLAAAIGRGQRGARVVDLAVAFRNALLVAGRPSRDDVYCHAETSEAGWVLGIVQHRGSEAQ